MTTDDAQRLLARGVVDLGSKTYLPIGCPACDGTGYRGRVGIYEMLTIDEPVRISVRTGIRDDEIRNLARSGGMRLMQEDALGKVRNGITTLDEVMRVVSFEQAPTIRCHTCGKGLVPSFLFCPYCGADARPAATTPPAQDDRAPGAGGVAG